LREKKEIGDTIKRGGETKARDLFGMEAVDRTKKNTSGQPKEAEPLVPKRAFSRRERGPSKKKES